MTTAGITGALVMVIEVMGSRVIGPFFGVSLFVWTSLITVTLVALAAGYAAGGTLADRRNPADTLYGLILLAGILAALVPLLQGPVIRIAAPLGLRTGALTASFLLFGPCLFCLGCVSPCLVRLAASAMDRLGRTVGRLYAVSTLGSFAGTVLTGFVLIAYLGVRGVFLLTGAALAGLAAVYFVLYRRRWAALAAVLPISLGAIDRPFTTMVMDNGTRVTRVHREQNFYADLQVLDYSYGAAHTREMVLDGQVQGGIDMTDGRSVYPYAYLLELLPWGLAPRGSDALVVGLGAGIVARGYEGRGVRTNAVEINPAVVSAARQWFGYAPQGDVTVDDARHFLAREPRTYDYIVLDVFTGDTTPGHLLTEEAMRLVRARLKPGGILAANLIGAPPPASRATLSILRTARAVFPHVKMVPCFDTDDPEALGNIILLARDEPLPRFDAAIVRLDAVHPMAREAVGRFIGGEWEPPGAAEAPVWTDERNPSDVMDLPLKERIRAGILRYTEWAALL